MPRKVKAENNTYEASIAKYWRRKYEKTIRDAADGALSGMKLEVIIDDGIVWWSFYTKRFSHEVVVEQSLHTGDWLRYIEQGSCPYPSVWKTVPRPEFRVLLCMSRASTIKMVAKYLAVKGISFTDDLSWPGLSAKKFLDSL